MYGKCCQKGDGGEKNKKGPKKRICEVKTDGRSSEKREVERELKNGG